MPCPLQSSATATEERACANGRRSADFNWTQARAGPVCSESGDATWRSTPPRLKYTGNPLMRATAFPDRCGGPRRVGGLRQSLGAVSPWRVLALPAGAGGVGTGRGESLDCVQAWHGWPGPWPPWGACIWVYWPVQRYGGVHWLMALPLPVLLSMVIGRILRSIRHGGASGGRNACLRSRPLPCRGLAWTLMELAMATLLSRLPPG